MIRVGLAGAGWVTTHHLDAWATLGARARVVAIADPQVEAARRRASQYGIPRVYDSVDAMLDDEPIDAIDIAAPREAHIPIARLAARKGIAILCQKPLAPTLAEAEAFASELDPRARVMVHENWRFRPHYRRIRSWIEAGAIGEPRTVTLRLLTSGLLPDSEGLLPALVRQPMLAGLERMLLMEVMIHHIDTLRFLLGPLELVGAQLGKRCSEILGEDLAALLLRTAGGAAVSVVGDFMAAGYPAEQRDRLEIFGTHGLIVLRDDQLTLGGRTVESTTLDLAANYQASYRAAIEHFVVRLEDAGPFETDILDNLHTLRIVEEAYARSPVDTWSGGAADRQG